MRGALIVAVTAALLAALHAPAGADVMVGATKWSQTPEMDYGISYSSMNGVFICADDFLCEDPSPIADIRWWGSYWSYFGGDPGPQPIDGFTIRFFSDIVDEFSHPDELLYETYVSGDCGETLYGYSSYDESNIYEYHVVLADPFPQAMGNVYWLSIQLDQGWDEPPYWAWRNSTGHWGDDAVQAADGASWSWYELLNPEGWSDDLAFELTIPEPAALSLLVLGGLVVGGRGLMRRPR